MTDPAPETTTIHLSVMGMSCASCVASVTQALASVPGVRRAEVGFSSGTATVIVDAEAAPDAAVAAMTARLVAAVQAVGYEATGQPSALAAAVATGGAESRPDRRRMVVAIALTAPLAAMHMVGHRLGFHSGSPALEFLQLVVAAIVVGICAAPIHRGARSALRHRRADMNVLVSASATVAFGFTAALVVFRLPGPRHFESAAMIVTFVLVGRQLEARARERARGALRALLDLRPKTARVLRRGVEQQIAADAVRVNDLVLVRAGEGIPADGTIVEGRTTVDESLITGESRSLVRGPGDPVLGGSVNHDGALRVRVRRAASDSVLSRIVDQVASAQATRASVERLVDRVAAVFVPAVVLVAVATFGLGVAFGRGVADALTSSVSVLVVACPCALGLATPTALAAGLGRLARLGILVRDAEQLELLARADTVVFDKTGTLTEGRPRVDVEALGSLGEDASLALAAAVEAQATHPLARAMVALAAERGLVPKLASDVVVHPGLGVTGTVEGQRVAIGVPGWAIAAPSESPSASRRAVEAPQEPPSTGENRSALAPGVLLVVDGLPVARFQAVDRPRPEAAGVVSALLGTGLHLELLTGDRSDVAAEIANHVGIRVVQAELLPGEKLRRIAALRAEGRTVAMVGDGVNDAPALATADVGIAVFGGADVAMATAGLTLLRPDLRLLPAAFRMARAIRRTIRQNLLWASLYNLAMIPLAAGIVPTAHATLLSPSIAAAAMSLSSITVVLNALRLLRYQP